MHARYYLRHPSRGHLDKSFHRTGPTALFDSILYLALGQSRRCRSSDKVIWHLILVPPKERNIKDSLGEAHGSIIRRPAYAIRYSRPFNHGRQSTIMVHFEDDSLCCWVFHRRIDEYFNPKPASTIYGSVIRSASATASTQSQQVRH